MLFFFITPVYSKYGVTGICEIKREITALNRTTREKNYGSLGKTSRSKCWDSGVLNAGYIVFPVLKSRKTVHVVPTRMISSTPEIRNN